MYKRQGINGANFCLAVRVSGFHEIWKLSFLTASIHIDLGDPEFDGESLVYFPETPIDFTAYQEVIRDFG